MVIRDASDVTRQKKIQLTYMALDSNPNVSTYVNKIPNGNGVYMDFLAGKKQCDPTCTGLPYDKSTKLTYRT